MNKNIAGKTQLCRSCGALISPVAAFCPNCGARGPQPPVAGVLGAPGGIIAPSTAASNGGVTVMKVVIAVAATMAFIIIAVGLIVVGLLGVGLAACFTSAGGASPIPNYDGWSSGVVIGVSAFALLAWGLSMWRIFK